MTPTMSITIPFNMTEEELRLEPYHQTNRVSLKDELQWLVDNADEEELPHILTSAVCLHHHTDDPIAKCLATAIIWTRG